MDYNFSFHSDRQINHVSLKGRKPIKINSLTALTLDPETSKFTPESLRGATEYKETNSR